MSKNVDSKSLIRLLDEYRQQYTSEDSKRWSLDWLKVNIPEEYDRLKNAKETLFSNRGFFCKLIDTGFNATDKQISALKDYFKSIDLNRKSLTEVDDTVKKYPQRKVDKISRIIYQLEDVIDAISSNEEFEPIVISPNDDLRGAIEWCEKEIFEIQDSIDKLKQIEDVLKSTYERCGGIAKSLKKISNKPTHKVIAPSKSLQQQKKDAQKISYKKIDKDNGLISLNPERVINASKVLLFNTKYKILHRFVASKGIKLSLSFSSIRGFDIEKSSARSIRVNPKDFFSKGDSIREFDNLNTKLSQVISRINSETVIVGAE